MKKTNNKGFSLVELIIVIAIMAVLVGILAPQFIKYVEKSRKSTDVKNVQEMVTAIQVYAADEVNTLVAGSLTLDGAVATPAAPAAATNIGAALTAAGLGDTYTSKSADYRTVKIVVTIVDGGPQFATSPYTVDFGF